MAIGQCGSILGSYFPKYGRSSLYVSPAEYHLSRLSECDIGKGLRVGVSVISIYYVERDDVQHVVSCALEFVSAATSFILSVRALSTTVSCKEHL